LKLKISIRNILQENVMKKTQIQETLKFSDCVLSLIKKSQTQMCEIMTEIYNGAATHRFLRSEVMYLFLNKF
jgi:hypothetical protein